MVLHSHEDFVSLDRPLNPSFPSKLRIGIWLLIANQQHISRIGSILVSTFRAPIVMEKIASPEKFWQWRPAKNRIITIKLPAEQRNRVEPKFSPSPAKASPQSLN